MQGGSSTMRDLQRILSPHVQANTSLSGAPRIEIYRTVEYLMPLNEAVQKLNLRGRTDSANQVICPGLQKDSFVSHTYDGKFESEYNSLTIVVDRAKNVVSVQLVCETPQTGRIGETDWYCYNFINYKVKALNTLRIHHDVKFTDQVVRIDTTLIDKRPKEAVRWFLPKPFAELVLYCVGRAGSHP